MQRNIPQSFKTGLGFGITSGVITTLGLVIGLHAGTHSRGIIIGGIIIIAIADSLSDSLGIHISQESNQATKHSEVWKSTFWTFVTKFIIALTFIVPVMLFPLMHAIVVSIVWGLFLLGLFSYYLAWQNKQRPVSVIGEHIIIAIFVIIVSHYVGEWVATF